MAGLILITGGARSGKTNFAAKLASQKAKKVVYLAVGQSLDKEMSRRIALHKRHRPKTWRTIEEPLEIEQVIAGRVRDSQVLIILDCLTLFLSNLLMAGFKSRKILFRIKKMADFLSNIDNQVIVVTNEVGSGIVPDNKLARTFRDLQGQSNRFMAEQAEEVYLVVCGQPLKIKPAMKSRYEIRKNKYK